MLRLVRVYLYVLRGCWFECWRTKLNCSNLYAWICCRVFVFDNFLLKQLKTYYWFHEARIHHVFELLRIWNEFVMMEGRERGLVRITIYGLGSIFNWCFYQKVRSLEDENPPLKGKADSKTKTCYLTALPYIVRKKVGIEQLYEVLSTA